MLVIRPGVSRHWGTGRPEQGGSLDPGGPWYTCVGWPLSVVICRGPRRVERSRGRSGLFWLGAPKVSKEKWPRGSVAGGQLRGCPRWREGCGGEAVWMPGKPSCWGRKAGRVHEHHAAWKGSGVCLCPQDTPACSTF